jgi:hypothetical protein
VSFLHSDLSICFVWILPPPPRCEVSRRLGQVTWIPIGFFALLLRLLTSLGFLGLDYLVLGWQLYFLFTGLRSTLLGFLIELLWQVGGDGHRRCLVDCGCCVSSQGLLGVLLSFGLEVGFSDLTLGLKGSGLSTNFEP